MRTPFQVGIGRVNSLLATVLLWSLALIAAATQADDRVRLALRLERGQTYRTRFTSQQTIKQTIQGQQIDMAQTMGFTYVFNVLRTDENGLADCSVKYEAVVFKQNGPAGNTDYDSTRLNEPIPAPAKSFAALIGQGFSMRISPSGAVSHVSGIDELLEQVIMSVEAPNESVRDMIRRQLKEQFGDEAIRQQMEQILAIYPDVPLRIGDSWKRRVTISAGFPLLLENTYSYRGNEGGMAIVDVSSKMSKNPHGKPMKVGPATLDFDIDGTQEGTMSMSLATGWVESSTLKQKFGGTIRMENAPGMQGAMSWPLQAEATVRLETLR